MVGLVCKAMKKIFRLALQRNCSKDRAIEVDAHIDPGGA